MPAFILPSLPQFRRPLQHRARAVLRLVLLTCIGTTASICQAGVTVYRDRPAFESAVGPVQVETFTDSAHFPISSHILNAATDEVVQVGTPIRPGDILPGVTYQRLGAFDQPFALNIDANGQGMQGGFLNGMHGFASDPGLTVLFDKPLSAFGFDTNLFMGNAFTVIFEQGGVLFRQRFPVSSFDYTFFGFVSDQADIASVLIEGLGNYTFRFGLDNFTVAIPEAPMTALWGSALCLWAAAAWRRRRASRSAVTPLDHCAAAAGTAG